MPILRHIISFNFYEQLKERVLYPHFKDKKPSSERLRNLVSITQDLNGV